MTTKPIAVVKPGTLTDEARQSLKDGGYAVIESDDLECVRLVQGEVIPLGANLVFHAAMKAINGAGNQYCAEQLFGRYVAELMADATIPKQSEGE